MMQKQRILLNIVTLTLFLLVQRVPHENGDILASLKRDSVRCIKTK